MMATQKEIDWVIRDIESARDDINSLQLDRTEEGEKAYQDLDDAIGWLKELKLKKAI
jgi:hypothetical protein